MCFTHRYRPMKARGGSGRMGRATCLGGPGRNRMKSAVKNYACEFADCMSKNGKKKMFKRREHVKRHIDTVHLKKKQFRCWVPGCNSSFTRNDNLTTHLKKIHGKNQLECSAYNRYP